MSDHKPLPAISLEHIATFQGYAAVPLHPATGLMPLQACLVVRDDGGGKASLVPLRQELFATAYLACLVDGAGTVHEWAELVCRTPHSVETELAFREPFNGHVESELERRASFDRELNPGAVYALFGGRVPALFLDQAGKGITVLQGVADAGPWELCTNDDVLAAAGLPRYTSSEHQYLWCPTAEGEGRRFVAVSAAAPPGKWTIGLDEVNPAAREWVMVTVGGAVALRRYSPLSFGGYCDLLVGNKTPKVIHGKRELDIFNTGPLNPSADAASVATGRLLLSHTGIAGKMAETLHLKIQALAGAMEAVRAALAATQRPLLTLTEGDLRVEISRISPNLPALWTSAVVLHPPADTMELRLDADHRYFIPNAVAPSIYTTPVASATARGTANLRVRKVVVGEGATAVFEGTFSSQERLKAGNLDLVLLKVNLGGMALTLATHLETDTALSRSEFRFRSMPVRVEEGAKGRLAGFEGAWVEGATFEVLPLLSSPSDLFSLAVLAMRGLLVGGDFPLPVALDEVMSLAKETSAGEGGLVEKIARLFATDERWGKSLGPQRLSDEQMEPAAALEYVPRGLWFEILAWIIQMIPGATAESYCGDFGQAPPGKIESVMDRPLREARRLLASTRSLLVVDWQMNREVGAAIREVLKDVAR